MTNWLPDGLRTYASFRISTLTKSLLELRLVRLKLNSHANQATRKQYMNLRLKKIALPFFYQHWLGQASRRG